MKSCKEEAEEIVTQYCAHREIGVGRQFVLPVLVPIVTKALEAREKKGREETANHLKEHIEICKNQKIPLCRFCVEIVAKAIEEEIKK